MAGLLRRTARILAACAILAVAACGITAVGVGTGSSSGDVDGGGGPGDGGPSSSSSGSGSSSGSTGDAGIDAPTTCTADLENDPANCGACGHDCQDGGCFESMCLPTVFVANEPGVNGVAIAGTDLVWTRPGAGLVRAMPLAGGSPTTRIAATSGGPTNPQGIASDGISLFITDRGNGFVWKWTVAGSPNWSVSPIDSPTGIAFDGTAIYITIQNQDHVASMPPNGAAPTARMSGLNYPGGVALTATQIFASSSSGIMSGPKDGGTPVTIVSPTTRFQDGGGDLIHSGIAIEGTTVFFTVESKGIVATVPVGGGAGKVLARSQNGPIGIVANAKTVYWANSGNGNIMKVAR